MPIIGTTDLPSYDPTRSMQLVSKIKKGSPQINGKWGKDLDHFRFDIQPQFLQYSEILVSLYGDEPKRFEDVLFVADTPGKAFDNWFEQYNTAQTLKVRCDGVTIHKYMPKGEFTHSYHQIPCVNKPDSPCECKQIGRLSFVLSDFSMRTGVYGYFMMETHSWHDLTSIFQALSGVHNQFGNIRNMKWILERVDKTVNSPKMDKSGKVTGRIKTKRSLVNLRPSEDSIKQFILPKLREQQILPESISEDSTANILQSSNDVETVEENPDVGGNGDSTSGFDFDRFLAFVQDQEAYKQILIHDITDALAQVNSDMEGYDSDTETLVAILALYWGENIEASKEIVEELCGASPELSVEDAMIVLDTL